MPPSTQPGSEKSRATQLAFTVSERRAKPGDVVQFPLLVSNASDHVWAGKYQLDADSGLSDAWTVVAPNVLEAGQQRAGTLELRVPKGGRMQPGTYPLSLRAVSKGSAEPSVAGAVLVIEARTCVFLPSIPKFELQADGSVLATISLGNCGNVNCQGSIQIRHKDGWHFSLDSPEVTINSGIKGVDAKLTLRPPRGKSAQPGDEVTLDISWQGQTLLVEPLKGRIKAKFGPPPIVRNALIVGSAVVVLVGGWAIWAGRNEPTAGPSRPAADASVLSGVVAAAGRLDPDPTEVHFTNQAVMTTSPAQVVTITNAGPAPVFVGGTRLIGANSKDFAIKGDSCTATTLLESQPCRLEVVFAPTVGGGRSAALVLGGDRGGIIAGIALTGEATAPDQPGDVSVDTALVPFGDQRIGISSAPQAVAVRNDTADAVQLKSATLAGPDRGDFILRDGCRGKALDGRALCRLEIVFNPRDIGGRSATLTIPGADPSRPWTVALSGTGTAPVLDVAGSLTFPEEEIGSASAQRAMTLTNKGTAPASVVVTGPSGPGSRDFILDNGCPRDLSPDASCRIKVTFKPTEAGARRAELTITHDGPGGPVVIPLSGTGRPPPPTRADLSVMWRDPARPDARSNFLPWEQVVVVKNDGPGTATGVELTIDREVAVVSASQGTCSEGYVDPAGDSPMPTECAIGTVLSGDTVTVRMRRTRNPSTASVRSNEIDPNPANSKSTSEDLSNEGSGVS